MDAKYNSGLNELHLSSNNYVLVLPGWYPNLQDQFSGDFNQRLVNAAGLYCPQVVLYIAKDQREELTGIETRYHQVNENIIEITVIYPKLKIKSLDLIYSNYKYVQLLFKYGHIIKQQWGRPALIHSYIVIRGGLGGVLLGRKWKVPFVLSENWTIYYPSDPGYLLSRNKVFQLTVKIIFKNVNTFLPVTRHLNEQVQALLGPVHSTVIPNVVDTTLFHYTDEM